MASIHVTAAQILHDDPWLNVAEAYDKAFALIDPDWREDALATEASRNLPSMLDAWDRAHAAVAS